MRESAQFPKLNEAQTAALDKAQQASNQGNHDYAIVLLGKLVREIPEFIDARRLLRANEIARSKENTSPINAVKIAHFILRGKTAMSKSLNEAINIAEEILAIDPTNPAGNELLALAAAEAGLPETEILAYETISEIKPNDDANLKRLAARCMAIGEHQKAQIAYERVLSLHAHDAEAVKGVKDACAAQATATGWDKSFQEITQKGGEEPPKPARAEQPPKISNAPESIDRQIHVLYAQFNPNRPDPRLARQIAELYEKKRDDVSALEWYEYVLQLSGSKEPVLEKHVVDLKLRQVKKQAVKKSGREAQTVTSPEKLRQNRSQLLLSTARDRAKRYPNDLALRFELGEALAHAGKYKEAIAELQKAVRHPYVRHRAFNLLGLCYWHRNMLDLARGQFEDALNEMTTMDDLKKEITYNLGCILEQMDQKEDALTHFKRVYTVDSTYQNVAERVEAAYQAT